jgi:hypothetical protein
MGFIEYNGDLKINTRFSTSFCTISRFAFGVRLGSADPLTDHRSQLVRLLLQLAHPLRLHGQIATDFRDLAFVGIR